MTNLIITGGLKNAQLLNRVAAIAQETGMSKSQTAVWLIKLGLQSEKARLEARSVKNHFE